MLKLSLVPSLIPTVMFVANQIDPVAVTLAAFTKLMGVFGVVLSLLLAFFSNLAGRRKYPQLGHALTMAATGPLLLCVLFGVFLGPLGPWYQTGILVSAFASGVNLFFNTN